MNFAKQYQTSSRQMTQILAMHSSMCKLLIACSLVWENLALISPSLRMLIMYKHTRSSSLPELRAQKFAR